MSAEVVAINSVERLTGLLANLVISNELVDQVKLAQMEDEELNEMSDKTPLFTSHFWEVFQKVMWTQIKLSTAYHPQTDSHS